MNTASIYREATKTKEQKEAEKANEAKSLEDALFAEGLEKQGFEKWLSSKETQALLKHLKEAQTKHFNLAMQQSLQGGFEAAGRILIVSDTIERIINYARTKTPIY